MPHNSSYLAYNDVKRAFEKALQGRGFTLIFEDGRAAAHWVSRANFFRTLDRKESLKLYAEDHLLYGRSPYDVLSVSRRGNEVKVRPLDFDLMPVKVIEL
jgi:hypothetical protein